MAAKKLLVVNAGSSSLKFKLFGLEPFAPTMSGMFDRIGDKANCVLKASAPSPDGAAKPRKWEIKMQAANHVEAMTGMLGFFREQYDKAFSSQVMAVGHRIVHGMDISQPVLLNTDVMAKIKAAAVLAPLHNPPGLQGIEAAQRVFQGVPQVAVFDTAFHQTMPPHAYMYALPYDLYEKHKIRRYGFHGTSHKYLAEQAAVMLNKPVGQTNVITCHLGSGSSIAAIKGGHCVDTTMGMTPLEGLMMGTRCGDLDPAVVLHIQNQMGLSTKDTDTLLNKKSGLLGVCGHNDLRAVIEGAQGGKPRDALGLAMFVYRVQKYIGAYTAALGGHVDAVVFSAGIGENSSIIRQLILAPLKGVGLSVDRAANDATVDGKQGEISDSGSKTKILVIPTDEELSIATQTLEVVRGETAMANEPAAAA
ncbi:hypothetical protein HYH03_005724 [Edaphochlamys debaryana]|uniref:Probable acetate kinase n=1 Tax=Edaphochlamys debaryana TaxID=47281 RepID=A0A836C0R4_9CHLO|nr:hypothetical protein HYH03_005724 [Edaphochlamys debaryana]|eukprot:KAG2496121.1 hypothetical protein HYH03_005724 [Edaphochlamys debaryana]